MTREEAIAKLFESYPSRAQMANVEDVAARYLRALHDINGDEIRNAIEAHLDGPNARNFPTTYELRELWRLRMERLEARAPGKEREKGCLTCGDDGWLLAQFSRRIDTVGSGARMVQVPESVPCPFCERGRSADAAAYGQAGFWQGRDPVEYGVVEVAEPVAEERVSPEQVRGLLKVLSGGADMGVGEREANSGSAGGAETETGRAGPRAGQADGGDGSRAAEAASGSGAAAGTPGAAGHQPKEGA